MTEPQKSIPRIIRCPRCNKGVVYDPRNKVRPFCSDRCKNADIVQWAEERYQIPGRSLNHLADEFEETPNDPDLDQD